MNERTSYLESLFSGSSLTSGTLVLILAVLALAAAWSICFVGAFFQVKRTPISSVIFALVFGTLTSFLLAAGIWDHFADLANEFTPAGLWFFSFVFTTVIFAVPLLQWLWKIHYAKSLFIMTTGMAFLLGLFLVVQMSMQPVKSLPARPTLPLFPGN